MTSLPSNRTIIIVARHAERQDYAMLKDKENWLETADRPWDPPLSDLGWKQGAALGLCVQQHINELNLTPMRQIYSSPFQRCRETAVAVNGAFSSAPEVKVEYGLAESLNEDWYRSWSLPTSNGVWGYTERDGGGEALEVNLKTLHRAALQPASSIIVPAKNRVEGIDYKHKSVTEIQKVYCWGSFETGRDQIKRLKSVVNAVARRGSTVMLVSHGGPVTHLFEGLTGDDWHTYGEADYASFSIYERTDEGTWISLVMNKNSQVP